MITSFRPPEGESPLVYLAPEYQPRVFSKLGDSSSDGHYFWKVWNDSTLRFKEEFGLLWSLSNLEERGEFDPETQMLQGQKLKLCRKVGSSYEVNVFISTPELNQRLQKAISNLESREKA